MCSDQEAVDYIRKVESPQQASKMLVDHALSKFSTDNLSVMVVRFNPKKVRENTSIDIGVQHEEQNAGISEVEMIVGEARRHSNIPPEGASLSEAEKQELANQVITEQREEQEAGPELTPEGQAQAEQLLREKQAGQGGSSNAA